MAHFRHWTGYTPTELDEQYNPRRLHPEHAEIARRHQQESAEFRANTSCQLDLSYGSTPKETFDYFPTAKKLAPALVYFHGGYWRSRDKSEFSFLARFFSERGIATFIPNYSLCPDVSISRIVDQCRHCVEHIHTRAAEFSIDAGRVHLAGHSAGAHIISMIAGDKERSVTAVSGLYDLEPVRRTSVNSDLRLDEEEAARNSPMRRLTGKPIPFVVCAGSLETEEFRRQTHDYAVARRQHCLPTRYFELDGHNHYSILDALAQHSPLSQAILEIINSD